MRGDVLVCTDDDCEAEPGWVGAMATVFEEAPSAAVAFCRVEAPPYDPDCWLRARVDRTEAGGAFGQRAPRDAGHGRRHGGAYARSCSSSGGSTSCSGPAHGSCRPTTWMWRSACCFADGTCTPPATGASCITDFARCEEGRAHARRDYVGIGAACAKPIRAGQLRGSRCFPLGVRARVVAADRGRVALETTAWARPDHGIHRGVRRRHASPSRCEDVALRDPRPRRRGARSPS